MPVPGLRDRLSVSGEGRKEGPWLDGTTGSTQCTRDKAQLAPHKAQSHGKVHNWQHAVHTVHRAQGKRHHTVKSEQGTTHHTVHMVKYTSIVHRAPHSSQLAVHSAHSAQGTWHKAPHSEQRTGHNWQCLWHHTVHSAQGTTQCTRHHTGHRAQLARRDSG